MGSGLAADGTPDGAAVRPHAVLLDDDRNTFITETVSTRQYCPLQRKHTEQKPRAGKDVLQSINLVE